MNAYALQRSLDFIGSWLEFQLHQTTLPGLGVAIYYQDRLIFNQAFGSADLEANQPLTTDHLFNVGSQAKMYTAVLVLQLAQQHQLNLDDPAARYLPWLRAHRDKRFSLITIRELLWHGAGLLREGAMADFWQLQAPFPDQEALKTAVLESALALPRGYKIKYSNIGYALLGQIVEAVSGQSYATLAQRSIIQPLGMTATWLDYSPAIDQRIARGYTRQHNQTRLPVPKAVPVHAFMPVTGWYMTPVDMAYFMAAQFTHSNLLLSEEYQQLLHNGQRHHWVPTERQGSDYGMGFTTLRFKDRTVIGHGGSFIGSRSAAYFDPADKLAVVVMANAKDAPIMQMTEGIFGVFDYFSRHATEPTPPERAKFNSRLLHLWQTIEIVATHQRIVSIFPDDWLPFDFILEELQLTDDPNTLKISRTFDMLSDAETVRFYFDTANQVSRVNYTGATALPEQSFDTWMAQFKNRYSQDESIGSL